MTPIRLLLTIAIAVLATGCEYDIHLPTTPSAIVQTPTAPISDMVEFRVTGDVPIVVVRMSNGLDGLTQASTVLPYSSVLTLGGRDNVFLSLDARGTGFGFLHAAIFVNGVIFREASASTFSPIVTINGTYRRAR